MADDRPLAGAQIPPFEEQCGDRWETDDVRGPHICVKWTAHVKDVTDDDHKCCCGATYWPETGEA